MAKRSQKRKVIMTDNNVFMASNSAKIKATSYFAPCIFISVIYLPITKKSAGAERSAVLTG